MSEIKVISVINMKGGVGKTTLTANLAYALAQFHKKKVILVDMDPQFNATQYFIPQKKYVEYINNPDKRTVLDIFQDRPETAPSTVRDRDQRTSQTHINLDNGTINVYDNEGKLDIIPSTLRLMKIQESERGEEFKLKRFLDRIRGAYDFIFIDCPPTMSIFTLSAYLASDAYIIPVKPDYLSSIGLPLLERGIRDYEERFGKKIKQIGVIFTLVDKRTTLMRDTMTTLRSSPNRVIFNNCLRHSTTIARAVKKNKVLFDYPSSKSYGVEIKDIAKEFLDKVGGH